MQIHLIMRVFEHILRNISQNCNKEVKYTTIWMYGRTEGPIFASHILKLQRFLIACIKHCKVREND